MAAIGDALAAEHPLTNGGWKLRLVPITRAHRRRRLLGRHRAVPVVDRPADGDRDRERLEPDRWCAPLSRARELAVRTAMGAARAALLRQFIVEGLVLSVIGALLSLPLAWAGLQG